MTRALGMLLELCYLAAVAAIVLGVLALDSFLRAGLEPLRDRPRPVRVGNMMDPDWHSHPDLYADDGGP